MSYWLYIFKRALKRLEYEWDLEKWGVLSLTPKFSGGFS